MELIADTRMRTRGKAYKIRIVKHRDTYAVITENNRIVFGKKGEELAELLEKLRFETYQH